MRLIFCSLIWLAAPGLIGLAPAVGQVDDVSKSEIIARQLQKYWQHILTALDERPFGTKNTSEDSFSFRFVCIPSFRHPMCIRIEHKKGETILYAKVTSGAGGYHPGKLVIDSKSLMSAEKYAEFRSKLQSTKFFEQTEDQEEDVSDGNQWVFEGNDGGKYHLVNTLSGGISLRGLGNFLLKEGNILPSKPGY